MHYFTNNSFMQICYNYVTAICSLKLSVLLHTLYCFSVPYNYTLTANCYSPDINNRKLN